MGLFTAAETPSLVRALALLAPAGARMTGTRIAALKRSFAVGSDAEARAMTRRLFARAPWPLLLFAGQLRTLYQKPAVLRIIDEFQAADALSEAQLEGLRMPTLLVWGRSEKLLPYEGLDYFRAHLPAHAVVREVRASGTCRSSSTRGRRRAFCWSSPQRRAWRLPDASAPTPLARLAHLAPPRVAPGEFDGVGD